MTSEPADESTPIAWIDESGSNFQQDPGTYILAAGLVWPDDLDTVRHGMQALLLKRQQKLHWRNENAERHQLITTTIDALPIEHLVVVTCQHGEGVRPERRRRITMERLMVELEASGVRQAIIESRGPADDKRDRSMLQHLRTQHLVSDLRVEHRIGRHEPLLWVPDAVGGMVTAHRCGDSRYFATLRPKTTLIELSQVK